MSNKIHYKKIGSSDKLRIFWLHGWGHSIFELTPLAEFFFDSYENVMIDLPGFGKSIEPDEPWDSFDYEKALISLMKKDFNFNDGKKNIVIGHSFGGKLSVILASKYPDLFDGAVLLASAGFKKKLTLKKWLRIKLIKLMNNFAFFIPEKTKEKIRNKFGSEDYKKASPVMKSILKKIIVEDVSDYAAKIKKPVLIIYGREDEATPYKYGFRFNKLIKDSKLFVLPSHSHNSILFLGKHVVVSKIDKFIKEKII